jgi:anti-sigma factor RsiW
MTCDSALLLLDSYLDDELDADLKAQILEHLASCSSCTEAHARLLDLRTRIRVQAPYYRASAGLRERIRVSVRRANRKAMTPWRWLAIAATILLAVSAAWNIALVRTRSSGEDLIAQDVISDHLRSLMGSHLLDVPSSDQHTVKPWFNGKLDFSPDVQDLSAQGFPLIGGRIDYVGGHAVAALVYKRRQHTINVFTWPSTAAGGALEFSRNGYHVIHRDKGGMTWWVVSDLNEGELHQFETSYK